jgi:hypothetical protein
MNSCISVVSADATCTRVQPIVVSGGRDSAQRVPTASDAPGSPSDFVFSDIAAI